MAAGLAALIFLTAYEIARDALLATTAPVRVENWMLAALTATAALPLIFGHFELRAGKFANSPALIADAREYRVHGFTTGLAFAALLSERFRFPLDRLAALVIVVAVGKPAGICCVMPCASGSMPHWIPRHWTASAT